MDGFHLTEENATDRTLNMADICRLAFVTGTMGKRKGMNRGRRSPEQFRCSTQNTRAKASKQALEIRKAFTSVCDTREC
jgi:hypothetical protein